MSQYPNTWCSQLPSGQWYCRASMGGGHGVHAPGVPPGTYQQLPTAPTQPPPPPPPPKQVSKPSTGGGGPSSGTMQSAPTPTPLGFGLTAGTRNEFTTAQRNVGAMATLYGEPPPEEYVPPPKHMPPAEAPLPEDRGYGWGRLRTAREEPETETSPEPNIPGSVFLYEATPPEGDNIGGMPLPGAGIMLQDENPVACKCEIVCGPPCIDETRLPVSEDGWKSNPDCETQVDESMALRVTLTGNPLMKSRLRVHSPSDHVRFGEMRFVGHGPHAGGLPGLWPIWDLSCRESELIFPLVSCDTSVDLLMCADKEGEYEVIAEWGGVKCRRTIEVKRCVCACFQKQLDSALRRFLDCPSANTYFEDVESALANHKHQMAREAAKAAGKDPNDVPKPDVAVKVICVEVEDWATRGNGAHTGAVWRVEEQGILVKCGLTDDLIGVISFELTNARNSAAHHSANEKAKRGELSKEEYATEMERVEWEGVKAAYGVAKKCVADKKWPDSANRYKHFESAGWDDFKTYLKDMKVVDSDGDSHYGYWEGVWESQYKAAYEAKHGK